jgi:hypothetical protein
VFKAQGKSIICPGVFQVKANAFPLKPQIHVDRISTKIQSKNPKMSFQIKTISATLPHPRPKPFPKPTPNFVSDSNRCPEKEELPELNTKMANRMP